MPHEIEPVTDLGPTPWMTTCEAAAYVRCSKRTLEGYRRDGGGPAYHRRNGRIVLYHRRDLDAWCALGRAKNTAEERLAGDGAWTQP